MEIGEYFNIDGTKTLDKGSLMGGNGTRITYYVTEKKESEGSYLDGKPDGNWAYFHENGRKASEGKMIDGKKEGVWRYYNTNGRLESIISFKDGEVVPEKEPDYFMNFKNFN
jgi:antitoxin component YwqK of YwqJK toxin-antitoxin module